MMRPGPTPPFAPADHVAEQRPLRAVEAHQLHLLHREESGRAARLPARQPSQTTDFRGAGVAVESVKVSSFVRSSYLPGASTRTPLFRKRARWSVSRSTMRGRAPCGETAWCTIHDALTLRS